MDAKERYAEVHEEVAAELYDLFINDYEAWKKVTLGLGRVAAAAFEYGQEYPKSDN